MQTGHKLDLFCPRHRRWEPTPEAKHLYAALGISPPLQRSAAAPRQSDNLPGALASGMDSRQMESPLVSSTWRDCQQMLAAFGWRTMIRALGAAIWIFQVTERLWSGLSRTIPRPKFYPSHRACPMCGEQTFYKASLSTMFTGHYTRSCSACGYCESRKVKMIRQL